MILKPQFRAELEFHFKEHDSGRRRWFMFGEDLHRRVPMHMDGVDGLNTVGMWVSQAGTFKEGDKVQVDCRVIVPDLYSPVVAPRYNVTIRKRQYRSNPMLVMLRLTSPRLVLIAHAGEHF